ncbi:class I SAM-dependent methyltransferase [Cohnella yongneupensis]|uniref:Class I SAM-dependent methyltransferase n=1 Tax=Cohnella yongneupensis TaxID=425006 RepID=A0ABW0R7E5_9BACL
MHAQQRTTPLSAIIKSEIAGSRLRGEARAPGTAELSAISFHHYMSLCLYHPDYGYYRSGTARVGRDGDFYTSAYIGEVMGEQLAHTIAGLADEHFPGAHKVEVVDWGGGTGRLGRQMMDAWASGDEAGSKFKLTVIDGNPEHRREALVRLEPYVASGNARVIGGEPDDLPNWDDRPVIVVANELLDAFPVHRLAKRDGRIREWGVAWDEASERFISCLLTRNEMDWTDWLEEQGIKLLEGQTFEVNLQAADWIRSLAHRMPRALLVLIDYGDDSIELSAPHRMDGTLLCYHNHRAHNDPYHVPGEQDLTAHVNFSHTRRAAEQSGWKQLWYGTQKRFLIESGVMDKLTEHRIADPFHPIARRNRAIRQLLLSDGMSELFKVQIFEK